MKRSIQEPRQEREENDVREGGNLGAWFSEGCEQDHTVWVSSAPPLVEATPLILRSGVSKYSCSLNTIVRKASDFKLHQPLNQDVEENFRVVWLFFLDLFLNILLGSERNLIHMKFCAVASSSEKLI